MVVILQRDDRTLVIKGVLRVSLAGDHLRTITERGKPALSRVEGKKEEILRDLRGRSVNVKDIVVGEPTLEDVFISLAR
jgi:hypothetical protein